MNKSNSGSRGIFILAGVVLAAAVLIIVYIVTFKIDFKNIGSPSSGAVQSNTASGSASSDIGSSASDSLVPSGTAESNHLKKSVFIGDFIPVALGIYTDISNSNVYADVNLNLSNIASTKITVSKKQLTTIEAVKKNKPENIYICIGSNDVNWKEQSDVTSEYTSYVRKLKAASPDSKIYLMSLTPVTKSKSSSDNDYNNTKIKSFNSWISNVAQSEGAYYLDIFSELIGDNGALPNELAESDGYHIKLTGCKIIVNYILSHAASDSSVSDASGESSVSQAVTSN